MQANELNEKQKRILLIGEPGSGKTRLAGSFAKPLLEFNWDGENAVTLKYCKDADQIEVISYDPNDNFSAIDMEDKICELRQIKENFPYKTIVIDGLTVWGQVIMNKIVADVVATGKKRMINRVPARDDYLPQMNQIEYVLNLFMSLPCTKVVIAHEINVTNKDGGTIAVVAAVSGKDTFAKRLPGKFSDAWHLSRALIGNKPGWEIQLRGLDLYQWCKTSIQDAPDVINADDIGEWLK